MLPAAAIRVSVAGACGAGPLTAVAVMVGKAAALHSNASREILMYAAARRLGAEAGMGL